MNLGRRLSLAILLLGITAALAFHSSGALSAPDALQVAAFGGGIVTSPAGPITTRVLELGVGLVRLGWAPTGIFRSTHLAASLLLAIAALLSAHVAARGPRTFAGGLAAAIFVTGVTLFGADLGGLGRQAGPAAVLLLLLSGAAAAWTAERPRAFLGGLLAGLAAADHPMVLFLLPGLGAMALGGTLRLPDDRGASVVRRAWFGFALGLSTLLLTMLDARETGLVAIATSDGFRGALDAWAGGETPFWRLGGPADWIGGVGTWVRAVWGNTGPLGLVLGLMGLGAFFRGEARRARPFLLAHGLLALAVVFGVPGDPGIARVLLGWTFAFWAVPAFSALGERVGPLGGERTPVIAVGAALILLGLNLGAVNGAPEKGVSWARTVLETAPVNSIVITENPVHLALAADGLRPDLDLVYLPDASSLTAFRTGNDLIPREAITPDRGAIPAFTIQLVLATAGDRPVLVDPSVYFSEESRNAVLGTQWTVSPHGIAFRAVPIGEGASNPDANAAMRAWETIDVTPDTPASDLRDGLTGGQFFARALLQSAVLFLEEGRRIDAERDFLLAIGHPDAHRNSAAHGLGRIFFEERNYSTTITILEDWIDESDRAAWVTLKLLATAYTMAGDRDGAVNALRRALAILPADRVADRGELQSLVDRLSSRASPGEGRP